MQVFEILNAAAFTALAVVTYRLWRDRRDAPSMWLAVTLGILAGVSLLGLTLPESDEAVRGGAYLWFVKLILAVLFLYPYALYRFKSSFRGGTRRLDAVAIGLTAAVVAASFALPYLPGPEDKRPGWLSAYILLIVVQWSTLSVVTAVHLWRAGSGQPGVARRRMRLLAIGAGALAVAILPTVGPPAAERSLALEAVARLSPLVAAFLFYLGFSPPGWLRVVWRRHEENRLRDVEAGLMVAISVQEVADALLPQVANVSASRGSLLLDSAGTCLAAYNMSGADAEAIAARVLAEASPTRVLQVGTDVLAIPLRQGWLAVQLSPFAPLFGNEEVRLLEGLGLFVDLALERVTLFERERAAREQIERATAELETLVYGVSHDLKSPIITLLGYLEYLSLDFGDRLPDEGRHYLDRMKVSALYMQDLIQDLLELSRIGRVQTEAEDVHLSPLVEGIAAEVLSSNPEMHIEVGPLPVVHMNTLRARQLFTNLIENAAKHGGRRDLTIRVTGEVGRDGGALVSVTDDGRGIPPQYRERVFGIFERLEGHSEKSGTGMGLAITRKIVEELGGQIGIVDADEGVSFCITLPPMATVGGHRQLETQR